MEIKTTKDIRRDSQFNHQSDNGKLLDDFEWVSLNDLKDLIAITKTVKVFGDSDFNRGALHVIDFLEKEINRKGDEK